ncbi:hypothetical protein MNB_SV-4-1304 [hydrothermal vent metagenome]|uniref:Uncharacterized protein n=1 Tax=hydrothermal vent metagenome TaxID=652676 RepID=A0A1W1E8D1_9ZZZZ
MIFSPAAVYAEAGNDPTMLKGIDIQKNKMTPQTKPKTWTHEQQLEYELARDALSSLEAILFHYKKHTKDPKLKERIEERELELFNKRYKFNGFDDAIVKAVNDTYWTLIRKNSEDPRSYEEKAATGINEKYLTTKVDYGDCKETKGVVQ